MIRRLIFDSNARAITKNSTTACIDNSSVKWIKEEEQRIQILIVRYETCDNNNNGNEKAKWECCSLIFQLGCGQWSRQIYTKRWNCNSIFSKTVHKNIKLRIKKKVLFRWGMKMCCYMDIYLQMACNRH